MTRKVAKPFVVEKKARSRKPPQSMGLFDESIAFDEMPARDINADIAELPDEGRDAAYKEALKSADSVFGDGLKEATPLSGPKQPTRTVLEDLTYVDPLQERLAKAAAVRRGRRPGSKNRPRPLPAPVPSSPLVAKMIAPTRARDRIVQLQRSYVGFLATLEATRRLRPGERWKLRLSRQPIFRVRRDVGV